MSRVFSGSLSSCPKSSPPSLTDDIHQSSPSADSWMTRGCRSTGLSRKQGWDFPDPKQRLRDSLSLSVRLPHHESATRAGDVRTTGVATGRLRAKNEAESTAK